MKKLDICGFHLAQELAQEQTGGERQERRKGKIQRSEHNGKDMAGNTEETSDGNGSCFYCTESLESVH